MKPSRRLVIAAAALPVAVLLGIAPTDGPTTQPADADAPSACCMAGPDAAAEVVADATIDAAACGDETMACCADEADAEPARPADQTAAALFDHLKTLVGTWSGDAMGTPATVTYALTGNGTTLVETSDLHGGMTTMYTLDESSGAGRVVATRYCAAGNQPRLAATAMTVAAADAHDDARTRAATFAFVDATGLKTANDPHLRGLTLTFAADGTLNQSWALHQDGKPAGEVVFTLKRAG